MRHNSTAHFIEGVEEEEKQSVQSDGGWHSACSRQRGETTSTCISETLFDGQTPGRDEAWSDDTASTCELDLDDAGWGE
jgi:hypothetical protein